MNLESGFRKVSEDDKSAVLEHENGHKVSIAKSGLSKKQLRQLNKLPLYQAEGSLPPEEAEKLRPQVELDMGEQAKQIGQNVVQGVANKVLEGAGEALQAPPESLKQDLAQWQQEQQAPVVETPPSFVGRLLNEPKEQRFGSHPAVMQQPMAPTESVTGGPGIMAPIEQAAPQQAGLVEQKGLATEPRDLAQEQPEEPKQAAQVAAPVNAPVPMPKYRDLMDLAADPNQPESVRVEALMQEQVRLIKDYDTALADWNRMMARKSDNEKADMFSNRSTWGKIGVAIGLLMGGMSAGITGKTNPVLELINKELEEETNRQKNARDNEMNLFKMNLQMLGDKRQAFLQTINQLRELGQLKADEIQAKSGNNQNSQMAAAAIYAENRAKIAKANTERAQNTMAQVMKIRNQQGIPGEVPDVEDPWIDRAVRIKMPGGQMAKRYVKDKSFTKEASDNFGALRRVQDVVAAINRFNIEHGQTTGIPIIGSKELNEKAKSLNEQGKVALAALLSGAEGKVRPGLLDEFTQIMPEAGAMFWNQAEQSSRVEEANKMIDRMRQELMDQYLVQ